MHVSAIPVEGGLFVDLVLECAAAAHAVRFAGGRFSEGDEDLPPCPPLTVNRLHVDCVRVFLGTNGFASVPIEGPDGLRGELRLEGLTSPPAAWEDDVAGSMRR